MSWLRICLLVHVISRIYWVLVVRMLWHRDLQWRILYRGIDRWIKLSIVLSASVRLVRILLVEMWLVSIVRHSDDHAYKSQYTMSLLLS